MKVTSDRSLYLRRRKRRMWKLYLEKNFGTLYVFQAEQQMHAWDLWGKTSACFTCLRMRSLHAWKHTSEDLFCTFYEPLTVQKDACGSVIRKDTSEATSACCTRLRRNKYASGRRYGKGTAAHCMCLKRHKRYILKEVRGRHF